MAEIDLSESGDRPAGAALSVGPRSGALVRDPERAREDLPGLETERRISDWGRSERLTGLADATVHHFLYHYWFRVEAQGLEHIPSTGGVLLVANHAGRFALDAAMIGRALREGPAPAGTVHLATPHTYAGLPGVGMALTKLGVVSSHPANLHRLLFDEAERVLVFPERDAVGAKVLRWRYRLRPFDGLPFVEAALRARVPIVPVAVLGAEEALPTLGGLPLIGRRLRVPVAPVLPLPAKFRIRFLEPIDAAELGEEAWSDPATASALREEVRALIQENLLELVAQRRSVWLG